MMVLLGALFFQSSSLGGDSALYLSLLGLRSLSLPLLSRQSSRSLLRLLLLSLLDLDLDLERDLDLSLQSLLLSRLRSLRSLRSPW